MTPLDLEEMTYDQIYIICADKKLLRMGGIDELTPAEAESRGLIQPGSKSRVELAREAAAAARKQDARNARRERRKRLEAIQVADDVKP